MSRNRNRQQSGLTPGQASTDQDTGQGQKNAAGSEVSNQGDASGTNTSSADNPALDNRESTTDENPAPAPDGDAADQPAQEAAAIWSWPMARDYLRQRAGLDDIDDDAARSVILNEIPGMLDRVAARLRVAALASLPKVAMPADDHPRREELAEALGIDAAHIFAISADHSAVVTVDGRKLAVPA